MKTVVLDDDPTGTQSASGVRVLLKTSAELIAQALGDEDSVYVQTNSRALDEAQAVVLVERLKAEVEEAAKQLGTEVQFVLRGDSTLRGHVFAETDVFLSDDAVMLFVPAFPAGGRTTVHGVHLVQRGDEQVPAHQSEYAHDPVFPFQSGVLTEYVREKSNRAPVHIPQEVVRSGDLAEAFERAPAGSVILPDAETERDIVAIAAAVQTARRAGKDIVVRSASPLAAVLAGVGSDRLLEGPLIDEYPRVLLVCGSHTDGATRQLAEVEKGWGEPVILPTDEALQNPTAAAARVTQAVRTRLVRSPLAVLTTERRRKGEHGTLEHGARIMEALTCSVRSLLPDVEVIIAKGGITSAEVARIGAGAASARVMGQLLPGVSVWRMCDRTGRELLYVVVPGNVGSDRTLVDVLAALRLSGQGLDGIRGERR